MPKLNQRGVIVQVLILLLLAAGLIGATYLVQHPTFFKPKAAPTLPQNPETSFELELESNPNPPFPDDPPVTFLTNGNNFRVDIYARADTDAANLFSAKIKYSPETVEFVEINKRDGQSFVKNWVDAAETNGMVSLVGGVPSPGIQTDPKVGAYLLGSVIFKAKKVGTAKIELSDSSAIYSNTNNINILTARKGAVEVPIQDTPPPTPSPTPATFSCTSMSVEGGIQVKNNSGQVVYYVVDSEGIVKITVYPSPSNTKLEWKEVSRSKNLPEGKFNIPVDGADNPTISYTVPKNSGNQFEGVDVRADVPWDGKNPQLSCPTVTFAVKPVPMLPSTTSITYNLVTNWNLIGLPISLSTPLLAKDFLALSQYTNNKCDQIIGFDASKGQATSYFSDPAKDVLNNMTTLQAGAGYQIHCNEAVSFNLSGTLLSSNPSLIKGWNLVSLPSVIIGGDIVVSTASRILPVLSGANDLTCDIIIRQKPGVSRKVSTSDDDPSQEVYNLNSTDPNKKVDFGISKTEGYWVHCNDQTTPTSTPAPGTGDGDLNKDSQIDLADASVFFSKCAQQGVFGQPASVQPICDLNNDRIINSFDFAKLKIILASKGII